jgi:glutathione S-transferase
LVFETHKRESSINHNGKPQCAVIFAQEHCAFHMRIVLLRPRVCVAAQRKLSRIALLARAQKRLNFIALHRRRTVILSAPATLLTAVVTLLAVLVALWTAIRIVGARRRTGIQPPATTGAPELECALRVQANTVEQLIIFLPALWLAALYFQGWIPGVLGLIWCVGRILYVLGYRAEKPGGREMGFIIAMIAMIALIVLAGVGIVMAWLATHAA